MEALLVKEQWNIQKSFRTKGFQSLRISVVLQFLFSLLFLQFCVYCLWVGDSVLITTKDGKWKPAKVTSINKTGPRSYNIVTPQGQHYRRVLSSYDWSSKKSLLFVLTPVPPVTFLRSFLLLTNCQQPIVVIPKLLWETIALKSLSLPHHFRQ